MAAAESNVPATNQVVVESNDTEDDGITLMDLFRIVHKHLLVGIITFVVVFAAVCAYTFLAPPKYSATAQVFAKSQLAAYDGGLPTSGNVFISVNDTDKRQLPLIAVRLEELGFKLWATEGTASVLRRYGIESNIVDKISTRVDTDPEAPVEVHHAAGSVGKNVVQLIEEGKIDMILNTPNSRGSRSDGYSIRAAAIAADLPQFTTITEFQAALLAIEAVKHNDYQIMSIQEHSKQLFELERREF